MATTAIWDIKGWLGDVVKYADDPEKTKNPDYMAAVIENAMQDGVDRGLFDVLEYAVSDNKTEQQYFVSGINCDPDIARQQMTMVKKQWRKEAGIIAFHGYQSFRPSEVTPKQAHDIGIKLANKLWGDRFQVVVATHLNTKCVHNHFVLNSVSFLDGKRYYDNKESYRKMRRVSDEVCKEYELSVIQNPRNKRMHYTEWHADHQGQRTWRTAIREDVDKAIKHSVTWSAFLRELRGQGYDIKTGVKHVAVRPPGKERFVRLRSLGDNYTEEEIKERILAHHSPSYPSFLDKKTILHIKVHGDFKLSKITWKGLRALYFFYRHKLMKAKRQPEGYAPYLLRDDLRKLDQINKQTLFLFRHKIDTAEQLFAHKEKTETELSELLSKRSKLNNERRHVSVSSERIQEISEMMKGSSSRLKELRHDVRLCAQVAEWSITIAEKLERLKKQDLCRAKVTSQEQKPDVSKTQIHSKYRI